jgi:Omp85 superfamily domain
VETIANVTLAPSNAGSEPCLLGAHEARIHAIARCRGRRTIDRRICDRRGYSAVDGALAQVKVGENNFMGTG